MDDVRYEREVIASNPHQVIAVRLTSSEAGSLNFNLFMDAQHEEKSVSTENNYQVINVSVKDGVLKGTAGIKVETDGDISNENNTLIVKNAGSATIWLSASTNYLSYKDVG